MNYDSIIIELLSRVQSLENQMIDVKRHIEENDMQCSGNEEVSEEETFGEGGYTRSQAREIAMGIVQKKFPDYVVDRAARREGSGIKVHKPDNKRPIIIKFYHSKSFEHRSGDFEHGWHVARLDDIIGTTIDLCIFSVVDSNDEWNFFIYTPDEIGLYNEENRSTPGDVVHFYFSVKDGKASEVREDPVDVSDHLNNWDVIKKYRIK